MNKNRKIPAFTMVDILTGMVITSIIVSMVFYLFTSLNKQVADYGATRNQLNTFLLLNTDLKRKFNGEGTIKGIPGGFKITQATEEISYLKENNLLIRKLGHVQDTLSTNLTDFEVLFNQDKNGNLKEDIKEVNLIVDVNGQLLKGHFFKDYGLIEDINNDLLHEF